MRVVIAGSRSITDATHVERAMARCGWTPTIVGYGGAEGVDKLGAQWADAREIPTLLFRANWKLHGKAAGPIRNRAMAEWADRVVLVWDGISRGTASMYYETITHRKPFYLRTVTQ